MAQVEIMLPRMGEGVIEATITKWLVNEGDQVDEDDSLAITLSADDVEDDTLTWHIVDLPDHGSLEGTAKNLTYTPVGDFNGVDSFTFKVNDGTVDSNIATVSITVDPVDDVPVANSQEQETDEDIPLDILLTAEEVDGDELTWHIVDPPDHGSLSGVEPDLTYTPDSDFYGYDSFTFYVNDGTTDSNTATVLIIVDPVNDPPVADDQLVVTGLDTSIEITLTASDVESSSLTYDILDLPVNGDLTGSEPNLIYIPDQGFTGSDSFTFIANDGALDSQIATVTISVLEHHCLTVDPMSISKVQDPGVKTTLDLSITNSCTATTKFKMLEGSVLSWEEGFESGNIPSGWEVFSNGETLNEWKVWSEKIAVYEGQYAAWVGYDKDNFSDEWLRSPVIDISALDNPFLSFMALTYTEKPGATMEVWILDDEGNPLTEEPIWDLIEDENWELVRYRPVYLDLSSFANVEEIRIDWRYIGQDGQSFGLDKIQVGGANNIDWLSSSPETGSILPSSTNTVTLTWDSTSLETGSYSGSIFVGDTLFDLLKIPVEMVVSSSENAIYLPLILR